MKPIYRVLSACLAILFAAPAKAQSNYPVKPIKIVVPYAAGGSPDTWTRIVVKGLEPRIGQTVIVENKAGGNSTIGVGYTAKSAPDGYTIGYGTNSGTSSARALFKTLPYDPINDLSGIIITQNSYLALVVRNEERGNTLAQFLDKVRRDPKSYSVGSASTTMEILNAMIESKIQKCVVDSAHGSVIYTLGTFGCFKVQSSPADIFCAAAIDGKEDFDYGALSQKSSFDVFDVLKKEIKPLTLMDAFLIQMNRMTCTVKSSSMEAQCAHRPPVFAPGTVANCVVTRDQE